MFWFDSLNGVYWWIDILNFYIIQSNLSIISFLTHSFFFFGTLLEISSYSKSWWNDPVLVVFFYLPQCLQVTGSWCLFMMWARSQCSFIYVYGYAVGPQFIENKIIFPQVAELPCINEVSMCVLCCAFPSCLWKIFSSLLNWF